MKNYRKEQKLAFAKALLSGTAAPSVFFVDADGTLVEGRGKNNKSSAIAQVANYNRWAAENGAAPVVLCTGRPEGYAEAVIVNISGIQPNRRMVSVVEGGALLYDHNRDTVIVHPEIAKHSKTLERISEWINSTFIATGRAKLEPKRHCITINPGQTGTPLPELYRLIINSMPADLKFLASIVCGGSAVDILPSGVDKGSGIIHASQVAGYDLTRAIGIGDSGNDRHTFEECALAICVGNAGEETKTLVKSLGGIVVAGTTTDGVLEAIELLTPWRRSI